MKLKHLLAFVVVACAPLVAAAQTNSSVTAEAAYTQTIEKRVADILALLDLKDAAKTKSVHDMLISQYRTLNDWHNTNDVKRKGAKGEETEALKASLKAIHEKFLAALAAGLSAEQVEKIKDKMTYGKVQFTYTGYVNEYPGMNDAQKARVLELLKDAREEAMDGGSSDEKSAIFNRYKGKINNYLSAQGVSSPKKKKSQAPPTGSTNAPSH